MVYSWGQPAPLVTSKYVKAGVPSQLSDAVALPVFAGNVEAEHSIVTLAGQVMTGNTLSSMVMIWLQVVRLPQASVAVQVRVIVYS